VQNASDMALKIEKLIRNIFKIFPIGLLELKHKTYKIYGLFYGMNTQKLK
jgi:hypothetical protein